MKLDSNNRLRAAGTSKCCNVEHNFSISLRQGLDPAAPFIKSYGFASTFDDALSKAMSIVSDPANEADLGCSSGYARQIFFKDGECVGLDYGSHSRFIIVKKQEVLHVPSVWRLDSREEQKPEVEVLDIGDHERGS